MFDIRACAISGAAAIAAAWLVAWQANSYAQGCANDGDPGCPPMATQVRFIPAEHRACRDDQECSLVYQACCPCGGDDRADAVNNRFAKQYEYQCSKAEIRACAQRGACALRALPVAVCRSQSCVVELRPIAR